jgi:3-deoxy-7-phosphoheptulonate synthase
MNNKFPGKDVTLSDLKEKFPLAAKKNKNHQSKINICGHIFGGKKIPIFAGPNMVESKDLIFDVAKNIKNIGASFMRGGAFKPLTFPYRSKKFNETREKGIEWLMQAKEKFKIPIITEVMETKFLPLVTKVTDIIQIGSRNMQNYPFLVDCAQTGMPIMLKRHYGSSIRDWLGAAEYILKEGNKNVLLCERGVVVPHTHRNTSRFLLDLQVIPAIKELTHLPIISDPSHATFWSPWVKSMTLASIAAGADGIMLEVHPNPRESAVDPLQPISYREFKKLRDEMKKVAKAIGRAI